MNKQKVCIIGGGLTGLITAAVLGKNNLEIDIITKNLDKKVKSKRALALSAENFNFLKKFNVLDFLPKKPWPCLEMKLYAEEKKMEFSKIFDFKNMKKHILYMTMNSDLMYATLKNIKKNKSITIKNNKLVKDIVSSGLLKEVQFSDKTFIKYNLIIICTGSDSPLVKSLFQNNAWKHSYEEISATTVLTHKVFKNNIVRQIFLDKEILALLPISSNQTSIVWYVKKKMMDKYKLKKNKLFKKKINLYTKKYIKNIKFSNQISYKNINLLVRKKYYKDRVILFGDALHVVHPIVGQGFNMTLRDLENLSEILNKKLSLGLDIGNSEVLSEFTNIAKPRNFAYSLGIDFIRELFSNEKYSFKGVRNKIIKRLNSNNFLKDIFFNIADKGFKF